MSPPCQPFTRQGLQKDTEDSRTQPFLHIMNELIPNMTFLKYVLLENVKGFEVSNAHETLLRVLKAYGFKTQEYLLCPKQLGTPNARLRYYMVASKANSFPYVEELVSDPWAAGIKDDLLQEFCNSNLTLSDYLDDSNASIESLKIDEKILEKHAEVLDIVQSDSKGSCCFTKAYGKYAKGTGSVIQQSGDLEEVFEKLRKAEKGSERLELLAELNLRYFSPEEVAHLLGFPKAFTFPPKFANNPRTPFRLLGNSLNVSVVALLTSILFKDYSSP